LLTNNQCDNTPAEILQMVNSLPEAMQLFSVEGTLTRDQMDQLRIPRLDNNEPPRDGLQLWRQGSVLLTNKYTMARLKAYRDARRPLSDDERAEHAAAAMEVQRLLEAQRLLDGLAAGQAKKRARSEAYEVEKVRRQSLTVEQRKQETAAKKVAASERKRLAEEETAKQTAEAVALVGGANPEQLAHAAAVASTRRRNRGREQV
jgi:hypothetical protein